jgi:hypothetical protein
MFCIVNDVAEMQVSIRYMAVYYNTVHLTNWKKSTVNAKKTYNSQTPNFILWYK